MFKKNVLVTMAKSFLSTTPSYVILYVTAVCNARCPYCFYWKSVAEANRLNELKLDEFKKISKNFKKITYLTITGGEPFLRPNLDEIIGFFIKNNQVEFVSIPTNGGMSDNILLVTEKLLKEYPQTGFRVAFSIDGIGQEHDQLRGVPGLFEKILQTYQKLLVLRKKYGNLNIDATSVYSSFTEERIFKIFEYVKENMKVDNHVMNLARGDVKDPVIKDINIKRYEEAVKRVEDIACNTRVNRKDFRLKLLKAIKLVMRDIILKTLKQKKMILPCTTGKRFVIINEKGEVYPCDIFINHPDKLLGKLREHNYDIKEILKSSQAKKVIKWVKNTKCHCTFECALQNNIVFNTRSYFLVLKKIFKVK